MFRLVETMIGFFATSVETYTDRTIPLLVSPDLEGHSWHNV
jgi:hypothetical protein